MGNDHFCDTTKRASQRQTPLIKGEIPLYHRSGEKPLDPTTLYRKLLTMAQMMPLKKIEKSKSHPADVFGRLPRRCVPSLGMEREQRENPPSLEASPYFPAHAPAKEWQGRKGQFCVACHPSQDGNGSAGQ